jgi:hypothetical protein
MDASRHASDQVDQPAADDEENRGAGNDQEVFHRTLLKMDCRGVIRARRRLKKVLKLCGGT